MKSDFRSVEHAMRQRVDMHVSRRVTMWLLRHLHVGEARISRIVQAGRDVEGGERSCAARRPTFRRI